MLWQEKLKSLIQEGRRDDHVTATWAALVDTKDVRIGHLAGAVDLLEKQLMTPSLARKPVSGPPPTLPLLSTSNSQFFFFFSYGNRSIDSFRLRNHHPKAFLNFFLIFFIVDDVT